MQKAYLMALYDLAEKDKNVLSLIADSGTGYDELFHRDFPGQFIDFGIAEEHMVAAAAGMAACGKIPFVFTAGAFLAYRSFEFIRDDVCFQRQNVKIVGMGSGLAWSTLGPTHHTTEDIGVLRTLPNLTILSPCCPKEVPLVVNEAYRISGPVYIRLGMNGEKDVLDDSYEFCLGKNAIIREGRDISIFCTGSIISEVLEATAFLEKQGISARVINVSSLKPFDTGNVIKMARKSKMLFSVEEHSIQGGLGSMISEVLAEEGIPIRLKRIGLDNVFAKGYGSIESVRGMNGLLGDNLVLAIKKFWDKL